MVTTGCSGQYLRHRKWQKYVCIKLHNKKINILLFLSNKARWLKWLGHKKFLSKEEVKTLYADTASV
jgi:cell division inhibitor SulA